MPPAKRTVPIQTEEVRLSERQQSILEFVYTYIQQHRHAPSVRDIGDGVGMTSTSNVIYHLNRLVQWGYLRKGQGTSRTLVLLAAGYHRVGKPSLEEGQTEMSALRLENYRLREWCRQLQALASDPDIHREMAGIHDEFAPMEWDGLAEE